MNRARFVCLMAVAFLLSGAPGHRCSARADEKPVTTFDGHPTGVTAVGFGADGKHVVSVCAKDVRAWETATGREIAALKGVGGRVVALSPEGNRVAIAGRTEVTIYDVGNGKEMVTIKPHDVQNKRFPFPPVITSMAFSPDGKKLATAGSVAKVGGGHGYPGGVAKVWDVETGKELGRIDDLSTVAAAVTFSRDGKSLAVGTDGAGGELPEAGEVWVWDFATAKARLVAKTREKVDAGENFSSAAAVALSPDGKRVAVAVGGVRPARPVGRIPQGEEGADVKVWDVSSGKELLALREHTACVGRVTFSPDGKRLASAGGDRVVRLWNTRTGKEIVAFPFDAPRINALTFSPDGRLLAAGVADGEKSGEVKVWACPKD